MGVKVLSNKRFRFTLANDNVERFEAKREFVLEPNQVTELPSWVAEHPFYKVASSEYTDGSGIERDPDIREITGGQTSADFVVPAGYVLVPAPPVSGTNVSDNAQAGQPRKGAGKARAVANVTDEAGAPEPAAADGTKADAELGK